MEFPSPTTLKEGIKSAPAARTTSPVTILLRLTRRRRKEETSHGRSRNKRKKPQLIYLACVRATAVRMEGDEGRAAGNGRDGRRPAGE